MTVLVESDQDAVRDIVRESKTENASALNYYFEKE
jgi:hypothetical protein